ncbi:Flp family type IVb pilin [Vibrio sp. CK2-1]|uniref:Flp family type IVb pilin n=1 Tax=Vibrio sp. CK2-1 TaxID=2912249 RepID=UPI001F2EB192|nr:Flp family type IVb pilin [Vibrio sp. CK2-1]MCF7354018.1 Flp family type IVb pilin [Vibrio sp. CK2-1]
MNKFMQLTKDFIDDEEGLTIVEYVLGAAALAAAITVIFTNWGSTLQTKLNGIITSA